MKESDLQIAVANYLRLKYPNVMFHSDFGSGIKLTKGQAIKQKRQNGGRRGWPDMFIAEPKTIVEFSVHNNRDEKRVVSGLFLELKKEGTRIIKKNGEWASPHIEEQWHILSELTMRGYSAAFAVGFENAKRIIDDYLGGVE